MKITLLTGKLRKNLFWTNKNFVYLNIITNFRPKITSENMVLTTWKGFMELVFAFPFSRGNLVWLMVLTQHKNTQNRAGGTGGVRGAIETPNWVPLKPIVFVSDKSKNFFFKWPCITTLSPPNSLTFRRAYGMSSGLMWPHKAHILPALPPSKRSNNMAFFINFWSFMLIRTRTIFFNIVPSSINLVNWLSYLEIIRFVFIKITSQWYKLPHHLSKFDTSLFLILKPIYHFFGVYMAWFFT